MNVNHLASISGPEVLALAPRAATAALNCLLYALAAPCCKCVQATVYSAANLLGAQLTHLRSISHKSTRRVIRGSNVGLWVICLFINGRQWLLIPLTLRGEENSGHWAVAKLVRSMTVASADHTLATPFERCMAVCSCKFTVRGQAAPAQ